MKQFSQSTQKSFNTMQDWYDYMQGKKLTGQNLRSLRISCYEKIQKHRKCPLFIYATKFLDSLPEGTPLQGGGFGHPLVASTPSIIYINN